MLRGDLNSVVRVVVQKSAGGGGGEGEGEEVIIETDHALSKDQVEWIKMGSALNVIKAKAKAEKGL